MAKAIFSKLGIRPGFFFRSSQQCSIGDPSCHDKTTKHEKWKGRNMYLHVAYLEKPTQIYKTT